LFLLLLCVRSTSVSFFLSSCFWSFFSFASVSLFFLYFLSPFRADASPFGLQQLRDDVGETCVIVTTAANDVISSIHERMPVILDRSVEMRWLDRDLEDGKAALSYLQPVSPDQFEVYPVSSQVSSARNQGPELIEPVAGAAMGAPRLL